MAENNAAINRSLHLHRDTQFAAAAIYQQLYGKYNEETGKQSVPATFQVNCLDYYNWMKYIAIVFR